eukprot:m.224078 g.224078  ORF g.224078 m.224078 type:complete len:168 (+) comp39988_c1_seq24:3763-4266(+)
MRSMRLLQLISSLLVVSTVQSHEEEESYHETKSNDDEHIYDHILDRIDLDGQAMRHLKHHLKQVMEIDEMALENADDSEAIYYLFKSHDSDGNNKLDGIELTNLFTDFHDKEGTDDMTAGKLILESEVTIIIDKILKDHDIDGNGYLEYLELASTQPNLFLNKITDR